jgi:hypothetical protein
MYFTIYVHEHNISLIIFINFKVGVFEFLELKNSRRTIKLWGQTRQHDRKPTWLLEVT